METYNAIILKVKSLMSEKKITQIELAEKLKTSRQTVKNYLILRTKIDIETLIQISEIFNVDINYFFENDNINNNMAKEDSFIYKKGNQFNIDTLSFTNEKLEKILALLEEKL